MASLTPSGPLQLGRKNRPFEPSHGALFGHTGVRIPPAVNVSGTGLVRPAAWAPGFSRNPPPSGRVSERTGLGSYLPTRLWVTVSGLLSLVYV